ncbi:MAG: glycosyl hydrolase family 2 [Acidobacteria bacterium]|nr:glycosyl hydrolase family 2 [Acidobacteriota bacterium]
MKTSPCKCLLLLFALSVTAAAQAARVPLHEGWRIQSSALLKEKGEAISAAGYKTAGWHAAVVPSTVVGALVEDKTYPDPFTGMNLRQLPGCSYPVGANFANRPMPDDSPYNVSWWYRTEFQVPTAARGRKIWLHFDGINYSANVWLNGRKLADAADVAGSYRRYEFDVTDSVVRGKPNALALEVFAPRPDDLALTWVDWNPTPPDKMMGLWQGAYLSTSGPVTVRHPQVVTKLDTPSLDTAHLTVYAELHNATDRPVQGTLRGRIEQIQFAHAVKLDPNETRVVGFTPEEFRQLNLARPRLWWPANLGEPNLYDLALEFETGGQVSDRQGTHFGIREITSELDKDGHRLFKVNGQRVLIRGGGWAADIFMRHSPRRLEDELRYVRDMHLNAIRLEGQLESDHLFEVADREGIFVLAGWCCCSHWEHWKNNDEYKDGPVWGPEDYVVAAASLTDQIKRLRNHPSLLVWLNGSDNPPPADVEKMYNDVLVKERWPNPVLSSATAKTAELSGESGVKMEGPYEWVPPVYWLADTKLGGAHGFATEVSPGPAVPPAESLRKMIPAGHLWPIDEVWNFHAGGGQFKTLDVFTKAMSARYGEAKGLEDYAQKSQLMAYEGQRAMFEAFARNRYNSTGVIQWMLNNAWPSLIWHLYDYYLLPGGGYFGTKRACEPVHVQYSYDDRSVVAVNDTRRPHEKLKLTARLYDFNLSEKFTKTTVLDLPADASVSAFTLPKPEGLTPTYFLDLRLETREGAVVSSNFYWLSTQEDALDWEHSTWYYTPASAYADYTQLASLPPAALNVSGRVVRRGEDEVAHVTLENTGRGLAFFVRLQVQRGPGGEEVLPVLWQDNYVSLLPGERREVTARYRARDLQGARPSLAVGGWNVPLKHHALTP